MLLKEKGALDEAAALFREILDRDPSNRQARVNLGAALLERGRGAEAESLQRETLASGPAAGAHNNLGNALEAQGRIEEAVAQYRLAIEADPENALAHRNLGGALATLGRH